MLESVYVSDTGIRRTRTEMDPGVQTRMESPSFPKIGAAAPEGGHLQSFYISLLLFFTSFNDTSA